MIAVEKQLPPVFIERLKHILSEANYRQYLSSLIINKNTSFRVNTLKTTVQAVMFSLEAKGFHPCAIPWCKTAFFVSFDKRRKLTDTVEFQEGFIYIQNPSSIYASLILDPHPGEEILDLAAAPGGKTLHIASLMENKGRLAAIEPVKSRFFKLKQNIENAGVHIAALYCKDGAQIGRAVPSRFDRVLLDAPCSSEARFNLGDRETLIYWSEKKIQEVARKQKKLIYSAIQALKPGGTLVYCTCSFAPEENEMIVQYALKKFADKLKVLPLTTPFDNFQQALSSFQKEVFNKEVSRAIRIIPTETMNGFFICKLQKIA